MSNEINVKFLTEDNFLRYYKHLEKMYGHISSNETNEWVKTSFSSKLFDEKKYLIEDFSLVNNPEGLDKEIDFNNSITLYEHLKSLPRYVLTNPRFWLWLHLDKFYKFAKTNMKINTSSTIKDHWHCNGGGNIRRSLMFGVLSRMYFRVALTIDVNDPVDKYRLTRWAIEKPERYRNLSWRSYSSEEHLVRGIIRGEMRAVEEYGEKSVYTEIAKYVSFLGSVMLLDNISEQDIEEYVYNKMVELLQK